MNPQPPRPPPPPKKAPAGPRDSSGSNKHVKDLSDEFKAAMRPAAEPPAEGMANMKIHKQSKAVGGVVHGPIRRPHNHRMIGIQSFEHGKIKPGKVGFIDDSSPNFARPSFYQGGYFARADHQLI